MKFIYLSILAVFALGCKDSAKHDSSLTEANITEQTDQSSEPTVKINQNADYSTLFNSPDCNVISADEISSALGTAFIDMNFKGRCSYKSEFSKKKIWYLSISINELSKSDIEREIKNFKSDETGQLALQMSESGDTYLCIQHSNGYLSMYNTNYESMVFISYGSVGESRAFSKEERLEHRELALKLANFLLVKHKK
jgi:hypothetical protein